MRGPVNGSLKGLVSVDQYQGQTLKERDSRGWQWGREERGRESEQMDEDEEGRAER
jgi:hypothetical protein